MLRIERISDRDRTTFRLSGELRTTELQEVRTEIEKVMPQITLDLTELNIVDLDSVRWLVACESAGLTIENSPPYIREWMRQERS